MLFSRCTAACCVRYTHNCPLCLFHRWAFPQKTGSSDRRRRTIWACVLQPLKVERRVCLEWNVILHELCAEGLLYSVLYRVFRLDWANTMQLFFATRLQEQNLDDILVLLTPGTALPIHRLGLRHESYLPWLSPCLLAIEVLSTPTHLLAVEGSSECFFLSEFKFLFQTGSIACKAVGVSGGLSDSVVGSALHNRASVLVWMEISGTSSCSHSKKTGFSRSQEKMVPQIRPRDFGRCRIG